MRYALENVRQLLTRRYDLWYSEPVFKRKPVKRKIDDKLFEWKKKSNGSTALLIDGAHRVGKSYIVEEFAKREYASCVLADLSNSR